MPKVKSVFQVAGLRSVPVLVACVSLFLLLAGGCSSKSSIEQIVGRWDVTIQGDRGEYPSWFEITSEDGGLAGRFVGESGSARPIDTLRLRGDKLYFSLPKQYEDRQTDVAFKGTYEDGRIVGETDDRDGKPLKFTAVRAPELPYRDAVTWGEPIRLIDKDLSRWTVSGRGELRGWEVQNGVLRNTPPTVNPVTKDRYTDFRLHVEFRVPAGGNSGVYLRGRYEVQVVDDHAREPGSRSTGSVYGFIAPSRKATKPAGEWNSFDITLIGRWITVEFNGLQVIDHEEIPGITGGAIDSREAEPGPILLQGDHQAIEYRNIILTPAE